jgi:uncharacterized BrkB/YihY/UPF0761 family membrane protein
VLVVGAFLIAFECLVVILVVLVSTNIMPSNTMGVILTVVINTILWITVIFCIIVLTVEFIVGVSRYLVSRRRSLFESKLEEIDET